MSNILFPPVVKTTEALVGIIGHTHTEAEATRFIAFAACTLFLYDIVTTIDYEVKYIWSNRWSIPRVVFHLNRIWPATVLGLALPGVLISNISPMVCKNIVIAYSYASIMVSLNIAVVVILRCWALYDRKPWVLKFLVSLLMVVVVPCAFVVKKQADDNLYLANTLPEILPGCIVLYTPHAWIPYTFALVFESIVFGMMLYKTYLITKDYGNTPLIRRLMIDGTLYYVAAIMALIFCLCAAATSSIRAPVISSGLLVSILSVMCSRMILSLYNFTEAEQLARVRNSGATPSTTFSVRFRVADTLGAHEDKPGSFGLVRGDTDLLSIEAKPTNFEVVGGYYNATCSEVERKAFSIQNQCPGVVEAQSQTRYYRDWCT